MEIAEGPAIANDFLSFGIEQLFTGIPYLDRIKLIEDIFLAAVKTNNDDVALKWLEIYEDTSHKVYQDDKNFMVKSFPQWLMGLYLKVPSGSISFGVFPAIPKTKDWMLKRIVIGWTPELNNLSATIFDFLIKEQRRILGHFSSTSKGHKEMVELIPKLIRDHTGSEFTPEQLEQWIKYDPRITDDILQVLAKAWVRNGGWTKLPELLKVGSPQ